MKHVVILLAMAALMMPVLALAADDQPMVIAGPSQQQGAVKPGGRVKINFTLKIKTGFHINSEKPGDQSMIPTKVILLPVEGFKLVSVTYPRPFMRKFSFTEKPIPVFEGAVKLQLHVKVDSGVKPGQYLLPVTVSFQACDNETCLMPQDWSVDLSLKVSP